MVLPFSRVLETKPAALIGIPCPPRGHRAVGPDERLFDIGERQLSPSITGNIPGTGTVTVPYGGTGLIDTSIEARVPITSIHKMPLGGAVFLDGGDVTNTVDQLDPTNLYWAIGAGLRLLTVIGPVRVDVGYRLNRVGDGPMDPAPGSHWAFHLTIGEAY